MGVEFRILGSVEADDGGLAVDLGGLRERTLPAETTSFVGRDDPGTGKEEP